MLKFFQKKVKGHIQGHMSKLTLLSERPCHKEHTCQNMNARSLRIKKVMANVKVFEK